MFHGQCLHAEQCATPTYVPDTMQAAACKECVTGGALQVSTSCLGCIHRGDSGCPMGFPIGQPWV